MKEGLGDDVWPSQGFPSGVNFALALQQHS